MKLNRWRLLTALAVAWRGPRAALSQTQLDLRTQSRNVDFSAAASTKPARAGVTLPPTCSTGELFFLTSASPGQNLYTCAGNVWGVQGPTGNYASTFNNQTSVTITAAMHGYNSPNLMVACYDASTPAKLIEADSITINPATFDVAVAFATPQSGYCVVNGAAGVGSAAAPAPAITMASQLGDFAVVRGSPTALNVGSGCSSATPCKVRFGNTTRSYTLPANLTLAGAAPGTGALYVFIAASGALTAGYNFPSGDSVACDTCSVQSGVTAFPVDALPLFSWSATWSGNPATPSWDAAGADQRAFLSTGKAVMPGAGLTSADTGAAMTLSLDTTVVGLRVGVPPASTSSCNSGSWAADTTYFYICVQDNTWRRVAITSW